MSSITQDMRYKQSLMKYTLKHGVKQAAIRYNKHPSYIYRWLARYKISGGNIESLRGYSKRPKNSPNIHTEQEVQQIKNLLRRNPDIGIVDLWHKLRAKGYARSLSGLHKALGRMQMCTHASSRPSPTYKPKPYKPMTHPGERIQIDVKYVPKECLSPRLSRNGNYTQFFQYTAIDEYSRLRILWGYDERNTYTSSEFLKMAVSFYKAHGIEVECVQVDNGAEFTSRFQLNNPEQKSLFELTAKHLNIKVKHIRPRTPRHNGKVERSHREDQKLFYSKVAYSKRRFKDLTDYRKKLKRHQDKTNNRPMRPLGYKSPLEYLAAYKHKDS